MSKVATEGKGSSSNNSSINDEMSSPHEKVYTVGNSTNIAWHRSTVGRREYNERNGHRSTVLWFTGLSGSGKSTLANAVSSTLFHPPRQIQTHVLDGDNVRHGLCGDLGFTDADRVENIRRVGHVASLFVQAGFVVITAFVSPFRKDRDCVRALMEEKRGGGGDESGGSGSGSGCGDDFIEVYCKASLEVCEKRDTKGLYAKARSGVIPEFTGISSPYEAPENPELVVDTGTDSLEACVDQVVAYLETKGIIKAVGTTEGEAS